MCENVFHLSCGEAHHRDVVLQQRHALIILSAALKNYYFDIYTDILE